jgi:two-component system response regulator
MNQHSTILLVEDNPDDVELTLLAFAEARILNPIVVARDGVEALEYLLPTAGDASQGAPELPVVVLLDLKLPRLSGLEVLERIRTHERTRRVPVVILTSSIEDEDRANSYDLHANSYVQKPVDFESFVVASRQMGEYWTALNQPPPYTDQRL